MKTGRQLWKYYMARTERGTLIPIVHWDDPVSLLGASLFSKRKQGPEDRAELGLEPQSTEMVRN